MARPMQNRTVPAWKTCVVVCLFVFAVAGCGSSSSRERSHDVELAARMKAELVRQLALAGKSIEQTTSQTPQGNENAPFDLKAELAGSNEEVQVSLHWTEQLVGDYDENGEVNQADLSPLGKY